MGRPKNPDFNPTDYKRGFNDQNYDRLYPWVPKGRKAIYTKAAKEAGLSMNELIRDALDTKAREVLGDEEFYRMSGGGD